jgi:hypothetical protein
MGNSYASAVFPISLVVAPTGDLVVLVPFASHRGRLVGL